MIVVGGIGLVAGIFALSIALGLLIAMWETWWLHPLWALVMVPLGLPAVSYWHLFAVNVFVSVLWMGVPAQDYAKDSDKTARTVGQVARLSVVITRPVLAFYVIRWALNG